MYNRIVYCKSMIYKIIYKKKYIPLTPHIVRIFIN